VNIRLSSSSSYGYSQGPELDDEVVAAIFKVVVAIPIALFIVWPALKLFWTAAGAAVAALGLPKFWASLALNVVSGLVTGLVIGLMRRQLGRARKSSETAAKQVVSPNFAKTPEYWAAHAVTGVAAGLAVSATLGAFGVSSPLALLAGNDFTTDVVSPISVALHAYGGGAGGPPLEPVSFALWPFLLLSLILLAIVLLVGWATGHGAGYVVVGMTQKALEATVKSGIAAWVCAFIEDFEPWVPPPPYVPPLPPGPPPDPRRQPAARYIGPFLKTKSVDPKSERARDLRSFVHQKTNGGSVLTFLEREAEWRRRKDGPMLMIDFVDFLREIPPPGPPPKWEPPPPPPPPQPTPYAERKRWPAAVIKDAAAVGLLVGAVTFTLDLLATLITWWPKSAQ